MSNIIDGVPVVQADPSVPTFTTFNGMEGATLAEFAEGYTKAGQSVTAVTLGKWLDKENADEDGKKVTPIFSAGRTRYYSTVDLLRLMGKYKRGVSDRVSREAYNEQRDRNAELTLENLTLLARIRELETELASSESYTSSIIEGTRVLDEILADEGEDYTYMTA